MQRAVCFLGYEHLGSYQIRGEQVASQRPEWRASSELSEEILRDCEIFCVVKHFKPGWAKTLRERGKTVVLDVVDSWDQPADNLRVRNGRDARRLFARKWRRLRFVDAHVFATQAMQDDLQRLSPCSSVIYHHCRPGQSPNPVREIVRTLGYEGAPEYLSRWRDVIERYCAERSLSFEINPASLSELDIGIAARGEEHDGYLPRRYKSNVKLANFYGTGTPCVVQVDQSGCHETDCGVVEFFRDERELRAKLDAMIHDHPRRVAVSKTFLEASKAFELSVIADQYEAFFERVVRSARSWRRRLWRAWPRR